MEIHYDSKNKIYEVEKIINRKFYKNKKYYLIKWLCYPISESTWEPKSNIKHLSKILKIFENNYPNSIDHEMYDIYCAELKKGKKKSKKAPKKEVFQSGTKLLSKKRKVEGFTKTELKESCYDKLKIHLYINMAKRHSNKVENEVIIDLSSNSTTNTDELGSILLSEKENFEDVEENEEGNKLAMPILE